MERTANSTVQQAMERKTLSSGMTFFSKFILAPTGILIMWAGFLSALFTGDFPETTLTRLLWSVVITAIVIEVKPLRRVQVGEGKLWVSNYFKEISIPLEQVRSVSLSRGRYISATIHLRKETEFGLKIKFYPAGMRAVFDPDKWEQETKEALRPS